jgi:hypothetical protein
MRAFAYLIACLAASAATACLAADPAACMSACAAEQRKCEGPASSRQARLMAPAVRDSSPIANGAQRGKLVGYNVIESDNSVSSFKRLAHNNACEAASQQCARDCGQAPGANEASGDDSQAKQAG